jgi:hypothetical protein
MRALVLVPVILVVAVAVGFAACRMVGVEPHAREMIAAAVACLIAGELAVAPLILTRGADQSAVAQAVLLGTGIHLFASVGFAAIVILGPGHFGLAQSFIYWLLGLYWVTLIALVVGFAKAVRGAPTAGTTRQ